MPLHHMVHTLPDQKHQSVEDSSLCQFQGRMRRDPLSLVNASPMELAYRKQEVKQDHNRFQTCPRCIKKTKLPQTSTMESHFPCETCLCVREVFQPPFIHFQR